MTTLPITRGESPLPEPWRTLVLMLEGAALNYGSAVTQLPGGSAAQRALAEWDRRRADLDAELLEQLRNLGGWRCYHCAELFTRAEDALEHFGGAPNTLTACQIKGHEHRLVAKIREQEAELARWRDELEPTLLALEILRSEHAADLLQAEELGYNRGVRDVESKRIQERAMQVSGVSP